MTTNGATFIFLVETSGVDHAVKRAAFTAQDDANAYAAGLETQMGARVHRIPLDQDFSGDWRTIIELDQSGGTMRAETKILTTDCITQAFFTGDPVPRTTTMEGRVSYRNIRLKLESEDTDEGRAMALALEVHRRAVAAGLWPSEGSAHNPESRDALQGILQQVLEETDS